MRFCLLGNPNGREHLGLGHPQIAGLLPKPLRRTCFREQLEGLLVNGALPQTGHKRHSLKQIDSKLAQRIPLNILIAEDNPVNLKLALAVLGHMGYKADSAINGLLALNAVKTQSYDLVIMDCQMPEMDGIEATRRIMQEVPAEQRPVVVALTAHALQEYRTSCFEAGMSDFLVKPISMERIQEMIETLFAEKAAATLRSQAASLPQNATPFQKDGAKETSPANASSSMASSTAGSTVQEPAPQASQEKASQLEPLVDSAVLEGHLMIKESFLMELEGIFEEDAPAAIKKLKALASSGDLKGAGDAAHGLKGAAASMGLRRLAALAFQLQKAGRAGQTQELVALAEKLDAAYFESLEALKAKCKELCGGGKAV